MEAGSTGGGDAGGGGASASASMTAALTATSPLLILLASAAGSDLCGDFFRSSDASESDVLARRLPGDRPDGVMDRVQRCGVDAGEVSAEAPLLGDVTGMIDGDDSGGDRAGSSATAVTA